MTLSDLAKFLDSPTAYLCGVVIVLSIFIASTVDMLVPPVIP